MKNRFAKSGDADSKGDNVLLFSFTEKNRVVAFWTKKDRNWHREFLFQGTKFCDVYYFWVKDDSVK